MDKMKFESADLTKELINKISQALPGVVSEGKVNFDLLRTMLGDEVTGDEAYELTWVGKREAMREAGKQIRETLRPCPEESKNWDSTENLYIEGDNLEVLKILQESYLGKVKMIYIDPPYNTGNDFLYRDDFAISDEDYKDQIGLFDEERERLIRNTETNGRFHSDWCSMIYPRLVLARNLLCNDGVIFISIDDNEVATLLKITEEVFGRENFIGCMPTVMNLKGNQDEFAFAGTHEYTVVFAKSKPFSLFNQFVLDEDDLEEDWEIDEIGYYKRGANLKATGVNGPRTKRPNLYYPIYVSIDDNISLTQKSPSDICIYPITDGKEMSWRWSKTKILSEQSEIIVRRNDNGIAIHKKQRPSIGELPSKKPKTLFYKPKYSSGNGTAQLSNLFGGRIFPNPKPIDLIKDFVTLGCGSEEIILDFFSGSATTAHAVMQLNAEDGGKRKFIMVQLPEKTDEKSEPYKAGYNNICEIGKERIRRAGDKIKAELEIENQELNLGEELKELPDIGFRVFKIADSNMNDVYYEASDYSQDMIEQVISNIKEDRTDLDLLYGCLLDWGIELSYPHNQEEIDGKTVHTYQRGEIIDLIACFERNISETVIKEIAKRKPLRVVFRDASFINSPARINVEEIFKLFAPNTQVKVI